MLIGKGKIFVEICAWLTAGRPVSNRIYISDADMQSASDMEALRIGRRISNDLGSFLPGKRKRLMTRIRVRARENPMVVMPLLLRHFDNENGKVRSQVRMLINEILRMPNAEAALRESLFSAHRDVSEAAAQILEERGYEGRNFKDLFDDTNRLFRECEQIEVHTADVEELVNEGIRLYDENAIEQAFENIILARDLLKDRIDWNKSLRSYIRDVLKMTPSLSQGGVQIDNIQESLRTLTDAVKTRDYSETRDIVEGKRIESAIVREMISTMTFISKRAKNIDISTGDAIDAEFSQFVDGVGKLAVEVETKIKEEKRLDALKSLYTFISQDFTHNFLTNISSRLETGDQKAMSSTVNIAGIMLRLISIAMPNVASELYEAHLKDLIGMESVDDIEIP